MDKITKNAFSVKEIIDTFIRVNHAGELGAVHMYSGHLRVYKAFHMCEIDEIEMMLANEKEHMEYFISKISSHSRPSLINSIWMMCSWSIGAFSTFLMQHQGTMSCTDGVETVVSQHYKDQLSRIEIVIADEMALIQREEKRSLTLLGAEKIDALRYITSLQESLILLKDLQEKISKFLEDEEMHRDSANIKCTVNRVTKIHKEFIMYLTKLAIHISERI
ncbi:putative ubiquinone biosynthesis protein [Candidatus Fokinia solitaria]|uniref:Putative ubiquinone biosynthesis protein n=1 Tax=Candidatus Fokinia solitaria TaxID=1802984 RepID=A0A2U8BS08_9RICK|nr:demethoxyubiquinone hydroxylase family protein [Candidatus Fokinia solitaria]AWD33060.1 putative ubiquinone biosynthesis protein [Candidatus Fokinia solitaria]